MAPSAPPSNTATEPAAAGTSDDTQAAGHSCFICLQSERDEPGKPFVNPCPCSLEAHESCLLRWIAEEEANRAQPRPICCPACKAPIRIDEPSDAVVALRDSIKSNFARASPYVLLSFVVGGTAVGSAWYGLMSAHLFAGPVATARWLGLHTLVSRRLNGAVWRWVPLWSFTAKIWALSLVGPALTIGRAIPSVGNILLIPGSLMASAILVAWDEMPTWPPSPAWAMTLFPFVSLTYNNIYYEFFGPFEKRLNRALRARPPVDEDRDPAPRRGGAAAGQQGAGEGEQGEPQDQSIWAALWGLGQAVVGIFRDQEIVLEAEVIPHRQVQGNVEIQVDFGEELLGNEEFDEEDVQAIEQEFQEMLDDVREQQRDAGRGAPAADQVDQADNAEVAPPQQEAAPAPDVPNNNNNNNNDEVVAGGDNGRLGATLTDIMSSVVLSLLYPTICFASGELLRIALPRSWVTRPPSWGGRPQGATGLLQRRWGRSLVGGCLYVVLKDAFQLYAKYRQVQQKGKRKVRNVERRRDASA